MPSHASRELRPLLVRPTVWNSSLRDDGGKAEPWIAETSRDREGRSLLNPGSAHPPVVVDLLSENRVPMMVRIAQLTEARCELARSSLRLKNGVRVAGL
jgi:hypothetical protein